MNSSQIGLDDWLKPVIRTVLQEVLAECGQSEPPKLYDVDAAAQMLAIPKRWLYERTAAGTIPHQKIGKYIRFTDADLRHIIHGTSGNEPKD